MAKRDRDEPTRRTSPRLTAVLRELSAREPIFHRPEFGRTRADFEDMTDSSYWEVGASGRQYSREFVLDELERRHSGAAPAPLDKDWRTRDFHCLALAADTFLLTYTLSQGERITRRATIWRRTTSGWKALYHQGTIVTNP